MAERGETGSAGRFGARYGRVARRRVAEIEENMRDEHECPECGNERVSRQGTGVWQCSYCDYTFTGGAYSPQTPGGRAAQRSIRAAQADGDDGEE